MLNGGKYMANSKNLKLKAYTILKKKILTNELKPNEYLEEKMLCEMLGISRTPIREAISLLVQDNLIQVIPRKGIFVTGITIQSTRDLFEARHLLEPTILKLSFQNMNFDILIEFKDKFIHALEIKDYALLHQLDYEFHNYITSCCRNSFLIKVMNNLSDNFQRVRTQEFYSETRTENGAKEHLELIELFIQGDLEKATELLHTHISNTESYYFRSIVQ